MHLSRRCYLSFTGPGRELTAKWHQSIRCEELGSGLTSYDVFVVWYTTFAVRSIQTNLDNEYILYTINLNSVVSLGYSSREEADTHEKKTTEKYLLNK